MRVPAKPIHCEPVLRCERLPALPLAAWTVSGGTGLCTRRSASRPPEHRKAVAQLLLDLSPSHNHAPDCPAVPYLSHWLVWASGATRCYSRTPHHFWSAKPL